MSAKFFLASLSTIGIAILSPVTAADATEPSVSQALTEDEKLDSFFEEIFQRNLDNSPLFQAQLGIKTDKYGHWNDFSDKETVRQHNERIDDLARLKTEFDYEALSEQSKVSYQIFEFLQNRAIVGHEFRFHTYGFSTQNNPMTFPVTFLQNIHRVDSVEDAEAYISRIRGLETAAAQLTENIDLAARRGIVPTIFSFDPVIADTQNLLRGKPFDASDEDSAILSDFRAKVLALGISSDETDRLLQSAQDALKGPYRRGVESFVDKVEELRDSSHGPHGVWNLPDGEAFYRNRISFWTTQNDLDANDIHQIGLADVKRIRNEMEKVKKQIGFDESLSEFFEFLRSDPSNFFPNTDAGRQAYLDQSKSYIDDIYKEVPNYFNIMPKAPLEVRRVEEWREETAPIAFYNQPSPDGSRPGIYYTNLKDMTKKQIHEMETIAYHEGAPGHHFQIAIQQELDSVPSFQKFAFFGAYTEGWALYAERLAKEKGRFTEPMQDFGRLQNEMMRAARLVVDTGIHSKKWSREKAIEFMLENNPMTEADATKEVERYIDVPGQALSYKIGMIKILDLRDEVRSDLGKRFDLAEFHDVVLKNGAVPLPILEKVVANYMKN